MKQKKAVPQEAAPISHAPAESAQPINTTNLVDCISKAIKKHKKGIKVCAQCATGVVYTFRKAGSDVRPRPVTLPPIGKKVRLFGGNCDWKLRYPEWVITIDPDTGEVLAHGK